MNRGLAPGDLCTRHRMQRTAEQVEEELLVIRCQEGDSGAAEALVARWERRLLRHALRLTGEAEAARDVAQESWLAIFRGLRALDDPARFGPWAYRIATRRCADWIRRKSRRRETSAERLEPAADPPSDSPDMRTLIRGLPAPSRAVLSMFYADEMSVAEIAEALGVPEGTVKSRLYTARERLRRAMGVEKEKTR